MTSGDVFLFFFFFTNITKTLKGKSQVKIGKIVISYNFFLWGLMTGAL